MNKDKRHNNIIYLAALFIGLLIAGNVFSIISFIHLDKRVDGLSEDLAKLIVLSSNEIETTLQSNNPESIPAAGELIFENVETTTLTASLPTDWSITENDESIDLSTLVGTESINGIQNILIKDDSGEVVIQINAAPSEITQDAACETYFQFPDYNQEHVDSKAVSEVIEVNDFASYELLGQQIRRFEGSIMFDTDITTESFEAACPEEAAFYQIPLSDISYNYKGQQHNQFNVSLIYHTELSDFTTFDTILDSLAVKES